MGRKKITIDKISDIKTRQVTFNKRKVGLMKKAMELSILCDCDIALIVFSSDNQLYQYSSKPIDEVLRRYRAYDGGYECLVNRDLQDLKPGRASSFKVGAKRRKTAAAVTPRTPKGGRPPRPFTAESPKLAAMTPSSSSFQMNSPLGAGSGAMSTHMPKLAPNPISAILPPADNPFDAKSPTPAISITSPTPTGAKDKDRFARLSVQVPPKQSAAAVVEVVDTRTTPSSASASGLASAAMSAEAGKSGDPFPTPGTFLVGTRADGSNYSAPASAIPLTGGLLFPQPSAGLAPSPSMDFLQTPGALFYSQFAQGPLSAMGGQFPLNLTVPSSNAATDANGSAGTKTDGTTPALPTPVHPPTFANPAAAAMLQQQMMMRQLQMQAFMQAQAGADPNLYASLGLPANTSAAVSTNSASPSPSASSASSSSVSNSTATNSQSSSSVAAAVVPNGIPAGLPLPPGMMFNMMDPLAFAGFNPAFYATTPGAAGPLLTSPGAFPSPVPWMLTGDARRFASPGALTREGIFASVMGASPSQAQAAAGSNATASSNSASAVKTDKS